MAQPAPPQSPPPYPPQYPPQVPPYYAPPPPAKSTNVLLIVVVVIIVIVIVSIVLAAVLFVLVGGLLGGGGGTPPVVSLGPAFMQGGSAVITVAGASSPTRSVSLFSATLIVNTVAGSEPQVSASFTITVGVDSYDVIFADNDGNGLMSLSDEFTISHTGGLPAGSDFTFELLWFDSSVVGFRSWSTP